MSIAKYIRDIGRGKEGARSLTQPQAYDLFSQVLDGHVTDLEIGAFALAMRIKGESIDELAGFLEAAHERCIALRPDRPTVVLPSYNGARKLPNLTALLALLLAQEGVQVLVHGPAADPGRVTTAEIFHDLGLPVARDASDIDTAWSRREPVFIRTESLCPPLARLLEVRRVVGLRNSGHTIAKLLGPCRSGASLRVVNYTHPEYAALLAQFIGHVGANAMLLRGTEGEPVADPRRAPKLDVYRAGLHDPSLSRAAHDGVLTELPLLPRSCDAATTALYIQSVISGEKPAPAPLAAQVDCLVRALAAIDHHRTPHEHTA
jgi:anthranilate phosphoribosyltransferase